MNKAMIFFVALISGLTAQLRAAPVIELATFDNTQSWETSESESSIISIPGKFQQALQLTYHLNDRRAFTVIGKPYLLKLPQLYQFEFWVKGEGPANTLEFKLIDQHGNTYLKKFNGLRLSSQWKKLKVKSHELIYGWGPKPDLPLKQVKRLELAVAMGQPGSGWIAFDQLNLSKYQDQTIIRPQTITVSSKQSKTIQPKWAADGNFDTRWSSAYSDHEWIILDFGQPLTMIGALLYWEAAYGKAYQLQTSLDGQSWQAVYTQSNGRGGREDIDFLPVSARYLKFEGTKRGTGWGYSLFEIIVKTDNYPNGLNQLPADYILKKNWSGLPVFLPNAWAGATTQLMVNSDPTQMEVRINNQRLSPKKQANGEFIFTIDQVANYGQGNSISITFKSEQDQAINLLFLKNEKTLERLRSDGDVAPIDYFRLLAAIYPKGYFPKWLSNEQDYWTIVGTETSRQESMLATSGMISSGTLGFSISPFIQTEGKTYHYHNVSTTTGLVDDQLPLPWVQWQLPGLSCRLTLAAHERQGHGVSIVDYQLTNTSQRMKTGSLQLVLSPFLVNPPWQHGGLTSIQSIRASKKKVTINEHHGLAMATEPHDRATFSFDQGHAVRHLTQRPIKPNPAVDDPSGLASALLTYHFQLRPGQRRHYSFVMPLDQKINQIDKISQQECQNLLRQARQYWKKRLDAAKFDFNQKKWQSVITSNLAYMLISKDDAALQPGSRCYENSWIRDGAIMSAALLRMGLNRPVRAYLLWIAGRQLPDGEIPCIVSAKSNTIPGFARNWKEHDGQGAFVFAVADYYRFTGDKKIVRQLYPQVKQALFYLENLRKQTQTTAWQGKPGYGMLPKSESHEGYIGRPQQSLWDDFWALKGWKDGQLLAQVMHQQQDIPWMQGEEQALRQAVKLGSQMVREQKKIEYIPASIGLADFDPTSIAIAVFPTHEHRYLDQVALRHTLDTYYNKTFMPRLTAGLANSYTPYELRTANAYNLLGEKEKALTMLNYFIKDLRPITWNHWAEVVHADYGAPAYVGDMPHTWIGAIFINTVRNLFLVEDQDTLHIGSGIDENWLKAPIEIRAPSYFGEVAYRMKRTAKQLVITIKIARQPPQGVMIHHPFEKQTIKRVLVNGKKWTDFNQNEINLPYRRAKVIIDY